MTDRDELLRTMAEVLRELLLRDAVADLIPGLCDIEEQDDDIMIPAQSNKLHKALEEARVVLFEFNAHGEEEQ